MFNKRARNAVRAAEAEAMRAQARQARIEAGVPNRADERAMRRAHNRATVGIRLYPPPGWYPDPSGEGQRYWNGSEWTSHVAP